MSQQQEKILVDITPISEIARQRAHSWIALTFLNILASYFVLVGNRAADVRIMALGYLAITVSLFEFHIKTSVFAPTVIAGLNLIFAVAAPSPPPFDISGDLSQKGLVASAGGAVLCAFALTRPYARSRAEAALPRVKDVFWPPVQRVKISHSNWLRKRPLQFILIACAFASAIPFVLFYRPSVLGDDYLRMCFLLCLTAYGCVLIAHRHSKLTADEVLKRDARHPIPCLRCFSDQKHFDSSSIIGLSSPTFEESLSLLLSDFGPSVTLSNPRNFTPPKGVLTVPVDNGAWQKKVSGYLDRAGLVVALVGSTTDGAGFRWELEELARRELLHRTVFIMPSRRDRKVHELWASLAELFQATALAQLRDFPSQDVVLVRLTLDDKLLVLTDRLLDKANSDINALAVCKAISMPGKVGASRQVKDTRQS